MAAGGEQQQRREVGGALTTFARGARVQEAQADGADEQEHQEAAGAGPEEAVVEPDDRTAEDGDPALHDGGQAQRLDLAERGPAQRVREDGDQRHEHDGAQQPAVRPGGEQRTESAADEGSLRHLGRLPDVDRDGAAVVHCGRRRADDRGELVGAEQRDHRVARQHHEQRRQLHETAPADDGVEPAGEERESAQDEHLVHVHGTPSSVCP